MDIALPSIPISQASEARLEFRMQLQSERLARMQAGSEASRRSPEEMAQIRQAAEEFEGMFIAQMLQHMFAGIETNPLFGDSHAEEIYQSMMVDEYGKLMAKSGGIGVADHVTRQLLQQQEVQQDIRTLSEVK